MRDRDDDNGHDSGDGVVPELDAADRALVDTLRTLPPEGGEPDWKKLEAAIRAEVSPLAMPAPWWRSWRWLVPIGALATTAAILLTIQIRRGDGDGSTATHAITMRDASVPHEISNEERATDDDGSERATDDDGNERAAAMWLDGEPAELDEVPAEALDALARADSIDTSGAVGPNGPNGPNGPLGPLDSASADEDSDDSELGVLPAADYQWIDTLRDDEAARLETYLARKRS